MQSLDWVAGVPVARQQQDPTVQKVQRSVEVARVIPHERMLRPTREGSSVRKRTKRFEMELGAKHMSTVEGPRKVQGDSQRKS